MFPVLIIILKILLVLISVYRIYILILFRRSDKNVRFSFDLFSMLEIDGCIALSLIGLLSRVTKDTYAFTVCILVLAILLSYSELHRMIIAGDNRILIGKDAYAFKEIKGMNASRTTLFNYTKDGKTIKVIVPLSRNETIRKMKYIN